MKLFPTKKSRVILVCIGYLIVALTIFYFIINDMFKSAHSNYQNIFCGRQIIGWYKPFEFRVDFFGMIYEGRSGNILDDEILYYGAYEKHILFFLRDTSKSLNRDDIIFFDIGANVGQHSLFMSKLVKEVHAFEPYPPVLSRFRNNIEINQINNVFIHAVGLANENGKIPFFEPTDSNLGSGSFIKKDDNTAKTVDDLPLVIGDEFLKKIKTRHVDIIKCDIEGYEKPALLGLKSTLEKNRPIVVMELTSGLETSFKNMDELHASFPSNYNILSFCGSDKYTGHYELCEVVPDFKTKTLNIVACPIEKKRYLRIKGD